MKTKHILLTGTLAVALAGVIFTGCKKKESTAPSTNTNYDYTAAQDNANASSIVEDTKGISDDAAKNGNNAGRMLSGCEMVTRRDTTINSVIDSLYDIYFGQNDCTCNDGRKRRGHILVWCLPGHYFTQGDTITMGFKNYYVNDIGVTGSRQLINIGVDTNGYWTWSFSASLTLTYPNNGGVATWTSSRTNTLLNDGGNWYYSVTGTASGVSRHNNSYSINITSPIYVTAWPWWLGGCAYLEAGNVTITGTAFPYPIYVAYGTAIGTCSSAMKVTINNQVYPLTQM